MYEFSIDEGTETLGSPSVYSPTEHGPYHWHVPVVDHPQGFTDWETSRTVTPQLAATEIFESMSMLDDDETTRRVFGPEHRTIRKHSVRRYRDHAGAWRAHPQILSDPRVTLSRETARGFNHPTTSRPYQEFSSSDSGPSVQSEAEMSLNQITRGSPKPASLITALSHLESPATRPRLIAGRPSYANVRTEEANYEDFPVTATFSYPPPSPKDAAAAIMKLKDTDRPVSLDGLAPVKVSNPLSAAPLGSEEIIVSNSPILSVPEDYGATSMQSSVLLHGSSSRPQSGAPSRPPSVPLSRSARSSPSQPAGPFSPPPISIEVNPTSSLRSGPPVSSPQVNPHRLSTHSLGEYGEYLSHPRPVPPPVSQRDLPYPQTMPIPPGSFSMPEPPAPWVSSLPTNLHPQGYSSQPMSRDPSHQSNSSIGSRRSITLARDSSPSSSNQALSSSPASQIMQRPHARRPSVVETEPSPRLTPLELDPVITSYPVSYTHLTLPTN